MEQALLGGRVIAIRRGNVLATIRMRLWPLSHIYTRNTGEGVPSTTLNTPTLVEEGKANTGEYHSETTEGRMNVYRRWIPIAPEAYDEVGKPRVFPHGGIHE